MRLPFRSLTEILVVVGALCLCVAADLHFLTYPSTADIGKVYTISWEGASGSVALYFLRGDANGSQDFIYSGYNSMVSWSPREGLSNTYWYYFTLYDLGSDTNITTSPVKVRLTLIPPTTTSYVASSTTSTIPTSMQTEQISATSVSPTSTTMNPSQTNVVDTSDTHGGKVKLSAGTIAGISIGSAAVFLLLVIAILLYRKQRRQIDSQKIEKAKDIQHDIKVTSSPGSPRVVRSALSYELPGHASTRSFELPSTPDRGRY